jgi:hypothetical protein
MNSTEIDVKVHAELHFYARQRLYQHARTIADEAMRKFAVDPIIQVFVAFTQYIQGNNNRLTTRLSKTYAGDLQEAIRTLMPLQNNDDTRLAALIALKDAHSRSKSKGYPKMVHYSGKKRANLALFAYILPCLPPILQRH